jgi:hypothetical protein
MSHFIFKNWAIKKCEWVPGGCTLDQQKTDKRATTHQLEFLKSMLYIIKKNVKT